MRPSLDDAYERLSRVDARLGELRALVDQFCNENREPAVTHFNPVIPAPVTRKAAQDGSTLLPIAIEIPETQLPVGLRSVVGEVVQSLRIPLDYLIHEIAYLDSGSIQDGTQFPICWRRTAFQMKAETFLKGVSPEHRHAVERLQPYRDGKWLGKLANLANPDKHRSLISITNGVTVHGTGRVLVSVGRPRASELELNLQFTPQILLPDRLPVVHALEEFNAAVRLVIDQFVPCFRGECAHALPVARRARRRKRSGR